MTDVNTSRMLPHTFIISVASITANDEFTVALPPIMLPTGKPADVIVYAPGGRDHDDSLKHPSCRLPSVYSFSSEDITVPPGKVISLAKVGLSL